MNKLIDKLLKDRAVFAGGAVVIVEGLRITHGHLAAWTQKTMDYGCPVKKSSSLHGRKSTPNPKHLGKAVAYHVCHIGPNFRISLIYAFIGCL